MKVLIIDDDDFDSKLIASSFYGVSDDVSVSILNNGEHVEGECIDSRPDLTLLDINMPVVDGFQVLTSLNKLPTRKDMSVIMLSGSTNPRDMEKAEDLGADGYCVKPSNLLEYRGLATKLISLMEA